MARTGLFSGRRSILLTLLGILILSSIAYLFLTYEPSIPPPPTTTTTLPQGTTTTTIPQGTTTTTTPATTTTQPGATTSTTLPPTTTTIPFVCNEGEIKCLNVDYKQTCVSNQWQSSPCSGGCKNYYQQSTGKTYSGCESLSNLIYYGYWDGSNFIKQVSIGINDNFEIGYEISNMGDIPVYIATKVYFLDPQKENVYSRDYDWKYYEIMQGDRIMWTKRFTNDICDGNICPRGVWYYGFEIWRWDIPLQQFKLDKWSGWLDGINFQ